MLYNKQYFQLRRNSMHNTWLCTTIYATTQLHFACSVNSYITSNLTKRNSKPRRCQKEEGFFGNHSNGPRHGDPQMGITS